MTKQIMIYFGRNRMIQVSLGEVAETIERLIAQGYVITSAESF